MNAQFRDFIKSLGEINRFLGYAIILFNFSLATYGLIKGEHGTTNIVIISGIWIVFGALGVLSRRLNLTASVLGSVFCLMMFPALVCFTLLMIWGVLT